VDDALTLHAQPEHFSKVEQNNFCNVDVILIALLMYNLFFQINQPIFFEVQLYEDLLFSEMRNMSTEDYYWLSL